MWPFKKKPKPEIEMINPDQLHYSQLDITEGPTDNERLGPDDWISTLPLNGATPQPQTSGLPPVDASAEEVYALATTLSQVRESVALPHDGVYCPVCHIANIQLAKLRTPCPRCGRPLLKFVGASLAGLSRTGFLDALSAAGVSPFHKTVEEIRESARRD